MCRIFICCVSVDFVTHRKRVSSNYSERCCVCINSFFTYLSVYCAYYMHWWLTLIQPKMCLWNAIEWSLTALNRKCVQDFFDFWWVVFAVPSTVARKKKRKKKKTQFDTSSFILLNSIESDDYDKRKIKWSGKNVIRFQ